jgi:hypothetical protein
MTTVSRAMSEAIRGDLSWEARWGSPERALVTAWEVGRLSAARRPELAAEARSGALIPLPWRGGGERRTKQGTRFGCLEYLAMWHGLRGEDLMLRTDEEVTLTCARTGTVATFTYDAEKYATLEGGSSGAATAG